MNSDPDVSDMPEVWSDELIFDLEMDPPETSTQAPSSFVNLGPMPMEVAPPQPATPEAGKVEVVSPEPDSAVTELPKHPPSVSEFFSPASSSVIWGLDITDLITPAGDPREKGPEPLAPNKSGDYIDFNGVSLLDMETLTVEQKETIFKILLARAFADIVMLKCYNLSSSFIESTGRNLAVQLGLTSLRFNDDWIIKWKKEFLANRNALSSGWTVASIHDTMVNEGHEHVLKRTIYLTGQHTYPTRHPETYQSAIKSLTQRDAFKDLKIGNLRIKHRVRSSVADVGGEPLEPRNLRKRSRPISIPGAIDRIDAQMAATVISTVLPTGLSEPTSSRPVRKASRRSTAIQVEIENFEQNSPIVQLDPTQVCPAAPAVDPEEVRLAELFRENLAQRFTDAEIQEMLGQPIESPPYEEFISTMDDIIAFLKDGTDQNEMSADRMEHQEESGECDDP